MDQAILSDKNKNLSPNSMNLVNTNLDIGDQTKAETHLPYSDVLDAHVNVGF